MLHTRGTARRLEAVPGYCLSKMSTLMNGTFLSDEGKIELISVNGRRKTFTGLEVMGRGSENVVLDGMTLWLSISINGRCHACH